MERHKGLGWGIRGQQMDGDQTFHCPLFTTPSWAATGDPGTALALSLLGLGQDGDRDTLPMVLGCPIGDGQAPTLLCCILTQSSTTVEAASAPTPSNPIPPQSNGMNSPSPEHSHSPAVFVVFTPPQ